MIGKEKTGTMSKMALFETSEEGKRVLKTISFFRTDFIRWEILKTVVSVTLGYAILLGLIVLYHLEYLIKNATKLNYRGLGLKALGVYLVMITAYISFTIVTASYKFGRSRKKFRVYERYLKELAMFYDKEEKIQEEKNDTVTGDKGQD